MKLIWPLLFILLVGCAQPTADNAGNYTPAKDSVATVDEGSIASLALQGVSVNRLGDHMTLIIPSHLLFQGYSVHFAPTAEDILGMVVTLIKPVPKLRMTVAAYSPSHQQSERELAMTEAQAQQIGQYLWRQGVNTRLLSTVGYGGGHLLSQEDSDMSLLSINYRVVITLEQMQ